MDFEKLPPANEVLQERTNMLSVRGLQWTCYGGVLYLEGGVRPCAILRQVLR